ncbi:MAG: heme ABC transporter permease [Rhizobiales bacterium]|nr:heme ABC transporter permease [Hyphomicrobiales bacterium]
MAAYHIVLIHFPIALWMTATLAILLRAASDGPLAKAVDRALVPLLVWGLVSGIVAYVIGLMVWPWETISTTPLGRNHMLVASWTVAYWALLMATRWIQGEALWNGIMRWVMAGLAVLGSFLLGITGTLGGHLAGVYTQLVEVLRPLGWEVYTTYYVPDITLAVVVAAAIVLVAIGFWGSRRAEA